ncbi:hypothetical protein D3C85_1097230 [compost metagenome]
MAWAWVLNRMGNTSPLSSCVESLMGPVQSASVQGSESNCAPSHGLGRPTGKVYWAYLKLVAESGSQARTESLNSPG